MTPLHVVFIIQSLGVGGAEMSLVNLINYSDPKQFRFSIIVIDNLLTVTSLITRPGVVIRQVPKRGKVSRHLVADLALALKEMQADIVHTHLFTADIWGTLAARKLGLPTVSTEHNINLEYGVLRTLVKRWWGRRSDRYAACSEAVKNYMLDTYAITKTITVIPNGIPVATFSALPPIRDGAPWRLVIIGRLVEQKGHAVALRALAQLKDVRWELKIVGDGPLKKDLQNLATELHIADRVTFSSFTNSVETVLRDSDLVLIPSLWEGLGVVAREAMAAGRLVLASDTGGLSESVSSAETGWLVVPGNIFAWKERLQHCFEYPEENMVLTRVAKEYALEHFDVAEMIKKYSDVYKSL